MGPFSNPSIPSQIEQINQLYAQLQGMQQNSSLDITPTVPPIQWVKGIKGAMAPKLKPNTRVALFDEDDAIFYLRSVDSNGVESPLKIGRFTLEDPPEPEDNIITKKDFESFKDEIRQLISTQNRSNQRSPFVQNGQNSQEVKK